MALPSHEARPANARIAVIIPCYRVTGQIDRVLAAMPPCVERVFCVDDKCPDESGKHIESHCSDPRVTVVFREANGGVGAATMSGYQAAIDAGMEILVKVDGDGQMDPTLIDMLVAPIADHRADYTKGNRFFNASTIAAMPLVRLVGNAGLSFMTKLSTGYWDLFDPTNGFTALAAGVAAELPFEQIEKRYFFESDLLFRLSILRARVEELPLMAVYDDEESNLSATHALFTFPGLHARNFAKRLIYNYFLRNFSIASINLLAGIGLVGFGLIFGSWKWFAAVATAEASTAGTVMLAGLPILLGLQLLLSFLAVDIASVPTMALHTRLSRVQVMGARKK